MPTTKSRTKTKMTLAQIRVVVAKEVLVLLRKRKGTIVPKEGCYLWNNHEEIRRWCYETNSDLDDARKHLPVLINSCHVCAIGALFVGWVKRYDGITVKKFLEYGRNNMCGTMSAFDRGNLGMIECAFEGHRIADGSVMEEDDAAVDFYGRYDNPKDRMVAIMKNIVKNKGTFKP